MTNREVGKPIDTLPNIKSGTSGIEGQQVERIEFLEARVMELERLVAEV